MKPECPNCGSENTIMLIYGEPTRETSQLVHEGKAVHAGCIICGSIRNTLCKDCEHEFDHDWVLF